MGTPIGSRGSRGTSTRRENNQNATHTGSRPPEGMIMRSPVDRTKWDLEHLHAHLQGVVDLELWTIPYYMTALYSIKDPSCTAYQLVQSALYQEMLHAQLASNLANAFGYSPRFRPPQYGGPKVPHVDFSLDDPDPTARFSPFSTELGPLDATRINTMCLIEFPEWSTGRATDPREDRSEYGSIGEFYDALRIGITQLHEHLRGGIKQVSEFHRFYAKLDVSTITLDGMAALPQAMTLIDVIVDQGEGQTEGDADVPADFQNTADGYQNDWPHYRKFMHIRDMRALPETWAGVSDPPTGTPGHRAQATLVADFAAFLGTLEELFSGGDPEAFGPQMAKLGGDVLTCWKYGAIPRFS